MATVLSTVWLLLARALLAQAQDEPQTYTFFLSADGSHLTQIDGAQVVGLQGTDTALGSEGVLFHLDRGGLYDGMLRGCWWASKPRLYSCPFSLGSFLQVRPGQHTHTHTYKYLPKAVTAGS